jgi:NADH:ubiquinone oxidoreductase subunit 3 (subunit A)
MRWRKRDMWKGAIAFAAMLLLLVAIVGCSVSAVDRHEERAGLAESGSAIVSGRREAMSSELRAGTVEKQTGRLESFSDGVFAVAMTLLVFNVQVPHLPPGAISVPALGSALVKQWPSYLTFMTSFATILIMWASHHSIFKLGIQKELSTR